QPIRGRGRCGAPVAPAGPSHSPQEESMTRPLCTLCLLLSVAVALPGCGLFDAGDKSTAASAAAGPWTRSEVYFGLSKPDGTLVADEDWRRFLDEEITPRFPAGFSVMEARGQYRHADGSIAREASKLLVVAAPPDQREAADAALDE